MSFEQTSILSRNQELQYAGFVPRFCSLFLDSLITLPVAFLPLVALNVPGTAAYCYGLLFLFQVFFEVYLVRRYGATPGKLMMSLRIVKTDGSPIGYREAVLRAAVDLVFNLLTCIGLMIASHVGGHQLGTASTMDRLTRLNAFLPAWCSWVATASRVWNWGELIVLLTNRRRRALHDFIAGTVVIVVQKSLGSTQLSIVPASPAHKGYLQR